MGERTGASRWAIVLLALAVTAGACSSPRVTETPGTTGAGALARAGAPVPSRGCSTTNSSTTTSSTATSSTAAPSTAAPSSSTAPGEVSGQRQDITVDGVDRWYLLTTPPTHAGAGPVPLVVDLHGLAEGATLHAETSQFGPEAQANGFMVVFPEGTGSPVSWDIAPSTKAHPNHDIEFMNDLLDAVEAQHCVDTSRVYADGFSDGALFTSLLACTMANRIAAFAAVAGMVMVSPCDPGRKVSFLAFHGAADPILYFNGGLGTAVLNHALGSGPTPTTTTMPPTELNGKGYPANAKAWAAKDGCNLMPIDTKVSPHVIMRRYRCPVGSAVEFYIVVGGGHAWPGSKISAALKSITGPSTFEINATDIIWKFFEQRHLAQAS